MKQYLGHYLTSPPSKLHLDLADDLRDFHLRRGSKENRIAPRGSAKTTWMTTGYVLYCIAEKHESFVLLLSETSDQAKGFLNQIKEELEDNRALARDYPLVVGIGSKWDSSHIVTNNGIQVVAKSVGGSIRGVKKRQNRPSLIVIDDPNERDDAYSPVKRQRKWEWFTLDVSSVGDIATTNTLVAGTPIHGEAICCKLKDTPGWKTKSYRSIIEFPKRMDMWATWERMLTNLGDQDRINTARAFYESHKAEMDEGAVLLWPERESLYDLMSFKAANGDRAFGSEKQDEPGVDGATEWPPEYFDWPGFWFDDWPTGLISRVYSLDPSKGKDSKSSDYQAHTKVGVCLDGTICIEADLRRENVSLMAARAINESIDFASMELTVEDNGTMGMIEPEFRRTMQELKKFAPLRTITNSEHKMVRIRTVGPWLARKQIRVRNTPGGKLLVAQWKSVPNGEFDDGPDSASLGIRRAIELINRSAPITAEHSDTIMGSMLDAAFQ